MAAEGDVSLALIETDFLFGLRRSDASNARVERVLKDAGAGRVRLKVLSSAVFEVRAVLCSRGFGPSKVQDVVACMDAALADHGVREFLPTEAADVVVAEELRSVHPRLGYFHSLHAAPAMRLGIPILGSEGAYGRIGVPFLDLDKY